MSDKKEFKKAGGFMGAGVGAGLIKDGNLGVAVFGTAFGVPLWLAGGLAGYGAYKLYKTAKLFESATNKAEPPKDDQPKDEPAQDESPKEQNKETPKLKEGNV